MLQVSEIVVEDPQNTFDTMWKEINDSDRIDNLSVLKRQHPNPDLSRTNNIQPYFPPDVMLIFFLTFLTSSVVMIATAILMRPRLENHPMCGMTTGGQIRNY
jgi:hypothetical protein